MDQFCQGLCNDVKDLLLTFHEDPKSLMEAISLVVRCDNRLFEQRSEHPQMLRRQPKQTYASIVTTPSQVPVGDKAVNTNDHTTLYDVEEPAYRRSKIEYAQREREAQRMSIFIKWQQLQ